MDEQASLADLRGNLERFLRESFGDAPVDQDNDFVVRRDGVIAWVRPLALAEGQTGVVVWSVSNLDMRIDGELTRFLATEGNNLDFAQFRLYESPDRLHVTHVLLGDQLSREELEVAVSAVTAAAARYGAIVKERFGGRRFGDPITGPVATPIPPPPRTRPGSSAEEQRMAAALLEALLRGNREVQARKERNKRIQALFAIVGLGAGGAAAFFAYRASSSWAVAVYAFLVATYFVARGVPDVITDPKKVRRFLYFATMPAVSTGVLFLTHQLWDLWWLAVLLALTVGLLLGAVLAAVLFPGIAREELKDDQERRAALHQG